MKRANHKCQFCQQRFMHVSANTLCGGVFGSAKRSKQRILLHRFVASHRLQVHSAALPWQCCSSKVFVSCVVAGEGQQSLLGQGNLRITGQAGVTPFPTIKSILSSLTSLFLRQHLGHCIPSLGLSVDLYELRTDLQGARRPSLLPDLTKDEYRRDPALPAHHPDTRLPRDRAV